MVPVLMLLMAALVAADEPIMDLSRPAESDSAVSVVHCDSTTYCPDGTTCCLTPYGTWGCCPYSLGQCCRDGLHCCPHGYHCDSTSTQCLRGWLRLPSFPRMATKAIQKPQSFDQVLKWQSQTEIIHCDGNVYCAADQFCCKTAAGQWGCCKEMVL